MRCGQIGCDNLSQGLPTNREAQLLHVGVIGAPQRVDQGAAELRPLLCQYDQVRGKPVLHGLVERVVFRLELWRIDDFPIRHDSQYNPGGIFSQGYSFRAASRRISRVSFTLEDHVPGNHLLRGIDGHLDLSDLRQYLSRFYSQTGRPSIDPEPMIRMSIVGYCLGIR